MKLSTIAILAVTFFVSKPAFPCGPMISTTPSTSQSAPSRERFVHNRIKILKGKRHDEATMERLDRNASWFGIPQYQPSVQAQRQHLIDEVELLALIKEKHGGRLNPKQQARMDADLRKLGYK